MKALKGIIAILVLIASVIAVISITSSKYSDVESYAEKLAECAEDGDIEAYAKLTGKDVKKNIEGDKTFYLSNEIFDLWSPFYRIGYDIDDEEILIKEVNLLGVIEREDDDDDDDDWFGSQNQKIPVTAIYEIIFEEVDSGTDRIDDDDIEDDDIEDDDSTAADSVTDETREKGGSLVIEHTFRLQKDKGQYRVIN